MPIYELGYRRYEGALRDERLRWWVITRTGIALAWRNRLLRRLIFVTWVPLFYFTPLFFTIGIATDPARAPTERGVWAGMFRELTSDAFARRILEAPASARPAIWAVIFSFFFSFTQAVMTFLVVAAVAPSLISQDVRTRAFLVYFSKPITRWEYLLGKAGTVLFYVFLVSLLPALFLYALSIAFSPSLETIVDTAWIVPQIVGCSLIVAVPSALLALFFSSLTPYARFAAVGWATACVFGFVFHQVVSATRDAGDAHWTVVTSLYHSTTDVQKAIFDVPGRVRELGADPELTAALTWLAPQHPLWISLATLALLCAGCIAGLMRRISAPMRI